MGSSDPCSFQLSVEHLLNTNAAPTDQQCALIREHILVQPLRDLDALDAEIKRQQMSIDELNVKRVALAADIDAHLALLTPVRHLPDEILPEIFVSLLPTVASREAPFSSAITPELWSSLHLVIPDRPRSQNIYALVEQWLARSGAVPLSISVAISSSMDSEVVTTPSPLDLLVAVSSRWKSVEFAASPHYQGDWLCRSLSALHPADVPILTSFKFNSADRTVLSSPFLATPTLSSVSLLFIPSNFCRHSAFSWHSITDSKWVRSSKDTYGEVAGFCEVHFLRSSQPIWSAPHWKPFKFPPGLGLGHRADDEDWSIDNDILYASRRVLPALKTLRIHGCAKDALLSFIAAQTAAGTPLCRLDIIFARRMVEDTLAPLAPFISNGLVASLKYVDPDDGKSQIRARYSPWEFTDVVR
ncbi:hypothetical protein C8R47DRAFT_1236174 [Mycena vitilis]|nr:hypothetical protein C8R47DRAFT_1236174 [Mycena vitilis]